MRQLKLTILIVLLIASGVLTGCDVLGLPFLQKKVYVAEGQIIELSEPRRIRVWLTNKETGKKELRVVEAQPGWYVGRPKTTGNTND